MRRRALLTCAGVTLVSGLAGCSRFTLASSPSSPRLGQLTVDNYAPEPQAVDVVIIDDSELIYWATREATAADGDVLGGAIFEDFPSETAEAILYARLDDGPQSEWKEFDFSKYDHPCLGLRITIGDTNAEQTGDMTIRHTTNPDVCN